MGHKRVKAVTRLQDAYVVIPPPPPPNQHLSANSEPFLSPKPKTLNNPEPKTLNPKP